MMRNIKCHKRMNMLDELYCSNHTTALNISTSEITDEQKRRHDANEKQTN